MAAEEMVITEERPEALAEGVRRWKTETVEYFGWRPEQFFARVTEDGAVEFRVPSGLKEVYGFGDGAIWRKLLRKSAANRENNNDQIIMPAVDNPRKIDGVLFNTVDVGKEDKLGLEITIVDEDVKRSLQGDIEFFSQVVGRPVEAYLVGDPNWWQATTEGQFRENVGDDPERQGELRATFLVPKWLTGETLNFKIKFTGPERAELKGESSDYGLRVRVEPGLRREEGF